MLGVAIGTCLELSIKMKRTLKNDILLKEGRDSSAKKLFGLIMVILGGGLIISTLIYVLINLVDRARFSVGVPGVVVGLVIILVGVNVSRGEVRD